MYSICIHVCILYAYHHTPPSPGKNCSQMSTGLGSQTKCTEKSCFRQNKPLSSSSSNCSNPMLLQFAIESPDLCERMHFTFLVKGWKFKQSLCLSLWRWSVKLVVRTYQFWQIPGQGGSQQMRSMVVHCLPTTNEISGGSLPMSLYGCIPSSMPFTCMQERQCFAAQYHVTKDNTKTLTFFLLLFPVRSSFH